MKEPITPTQNPLYQPDIKVKPGRPVSMANLGIQTSSFHPTSVEKLRGQLTKSNSSSPKTPNSWSPRTPSKTKDRFVFNFPNDEPRKRKNTVMKKTSFSTTSLSRLKGKNCLKLKLLKYTMIAPLLKCFQGLPEY